MMLAFALFASTVFVALSTQSPTPLTTQRPRGYGNDTKSKVKCDRLTFNDQGEFQISMFVDLHFGETIYADLHRCLGHMGAATRLNSVKVLNKILDSESPDLVVLNGDLITGENAYLENSTAYIDQIAAPLVNHGVKWASTYGNHDHNYNISAKDILAREQRFPNALTKSMVSGRNAGVSNYYLPVYAPDCTTRNCAPEMLLWFFDSRGGFYYRENHEDGSQVGQPDWVDVSVVNWYQATNARITGRFGKVIPSLAFVHIPTYASLALQTEHGRDSINPNHQPGINDDYPLAPQAQGWCPDGRNDGSCSYGGQDVPFMQAITTMPGLMGVFSGHDHGATWCYKWDRLVPGMTVAGNGVNLCFGQHSGYGGYGNWIRGSRQVRISRDDLKDKKWEAKTWIRLESGDIVGNVNLNATYGQDWYPATPNDMTYCPTCNYTVVTPGPVRRKRSTRT